MPEELIDAFGSLYEQHRVQKQCAAKQHLPSRDALERLLAQPAHRVGEHGELPPPQLATMCAEALSETGGATAAGAHGETSNDVDDEQTRSSDGSDSATASSENSGGTLRSKTTGGGGGGGGVGSNANAATASASPPAKKPLPVHVVLSADDRMWANLLTVIKSVIVNAGDYRRFVFHIILAPNEIERFEAYADCLVGEPFRGMLHAWPADFGHLSLGSRNNELVHKRLKAAHNFARFVLADVLPLTIHKVIWLDADLVLQWDLAKLYDKSLRGPTDADAPDGTAASEVNSPTIAAAVVERNRFPVLFNVSANSPLVRAAPELQLEQCQTKPCFFFNAGVMLIRLDRWRRRGTLERVHKWIDFFAQVKKIEKKMFF